MRMLNSPKDAIKRVVFVPSQASKANCIHEPLNHSLKRLKHWFSKGFYDFSFISQDSSSFLRDAGEKEGLIKLIDAVEQIEGVKSARILYLYPTTTSNALIERIISSPLFHNYFDMPIQHISDSMLKRMKRGAGRERIIEQLELMRKAPNSFIRTSFIVGHPGESEAEFQELLDFTKSFDFDRVNIFCLFGRRRYISVCNGRENRH